MEPVLGEGERLLEEVRPRLLALADDEVFPPFMEPQALAASALLAADFMGQPRWRRQVDALVQAGATKPVQASDLVALARAVLHLLSLIGAGGPWMSDRESPAAAEVAKQAAPLRHKLTGLVELRLHGVDEARLWLESVRLGRGRVDLLLDLRSLGELCRTYGDEVGSPPDVAVIHDAARCADALEAALLGEEAPGVRDARRLLSRAWTLLVPAYRELCRLGRFLSDDRYGAGLFPSLPAISRARRRDRAGAAARASVIPESRPVSSLPVPAPPPSETEPPRSGVMAAAALAAMSARPGAAAAQEGKPAVAAPPLPGRAAVLLERDLPPASVHAIAPDARAAPVPPPPPEASLPPLALRPPLLPGSARPSQSVAPHATAPFPAARVSVAPDPFASPAPRPASIAPTALRSIPPEGFPVTRTIAPGPLGERRRMVELEVGIASESNLYLGFAENLSDGGIFVATYAPLPIGAVVDLRISIPTSARPVSIRGEVRWIRAARGPEGGWPGMGIRFCELAPPDEAALRAFARQRDPLFFVE